MYGCRFLKFAGVFASLAFFGEISAVAQAQTITPDTTLGIEGSVVTPIDPLTDHIEGGAERGINLFHSFQEFSIGQQRTANFINPAGIENIFSRVTGDSRSDILGTLGVLGNANLFFINPNGILFGPDASLDIQGSFTASTANEVIFADGSTFSALTPTNPPLLSVDVSTPVEVVFEGGIPGDIEIVGNTFNPRSLSVGGDLTLVANDIDLLPGAFVDSSFGGDILFDVQQKLSAVDSQISSGTGGDITIEAQGLSMDNSSIFSTNLLPPFVPASVGTITVNVSGPIDLQNSSRIASTGGFSLANSGDVNINAQSLTAINGSQISTQAFTNAGDIIIDLTEELLLEGIQDTSNFITGLFSASAILSTGTPGNAGDVKISSGSLEVSSGAFISNGSQGQGEAGVVEIIASDSIIIDGFASLDDGTSLHTFVGGTRADGISSSTGGTADIVRVSARKIAVSNGALISSGTLDGGSSGLVDVTAIDTVTVDGAGPNWPSGIGVGTVRSGTTDEVQIRTGDLFVTNGGVVLSRSIGEGQAGSVEIIASGDVIVDGISPLTGEPSGLDLQSFSSADAGNVNIIADQLFVSNGARVDVSNEEDGNGGTLIANTRNIFLENQGSLSADTVSGEGGLIDLNLQGIVLMRGDSLISAESFSDLGNSGNIEIDSGFIFAIPTENSDIIASAFKEGNIDIKAQGIFGLEAREELTPFSDITATGIITLDLPDFDPTQSLTTLPEEPRETEVDNTCRVSSNEDAVEFYDVGRGGSPPRPDDVAEANLEFLLEEEVSISEVIGETDAISTSIATDPSQESVENSETVTQLELVSFVPLPVCAGTR